LKTVPIKLHWPSRGGEKEPPPLAGGNHVKSNIVRGKGPTHHRPWFWLPPNVQIVSGILGRVPLDEPHVIHLGEGEPEVREDQWSSH
jgi:hypothetical protein